MPTNPDKVVNVEEGKSLIWEKSVIEFVYSIKGSEKSN
jgi:hypothetical protein